MTSWYVLGGGISGTIAGYILNAPVVTRPEKPIPFPLGPQYLYADPLTEKLLQTLGLPTTTRTVKFGFFDPDVGVSEPTPELAERYYISTRNRRPPHWWISRHTKFFEAFEVSPRRLHETLKRKVEIIYDEIYAIDLKRKVLIGEEKHHYDKLVSTIPLPVFSRLSGLHLEGTLSWKPITFRRVHVDELPFDIYETEFDYVYLIGHDVYRVTRHTPPYVVEEILGESEGHVLQYGKILGGRPITIKDVVFLGRYAEWNPRILVHHVLRKTVKLSLQLSRV